MEVRFIAHAGVAIEEKGFQLLIDPWFFDSTPEHPVIESIGGGFKAIDFQIPKTSEKIENYAPDVILVSHFHSHHSPMRDIRTLCENSTAKGKTVHLFSPEPSEEAERNLLERVPSAVIRKGIRSDEPFTIGPFIIEAKGHTNPYHQSWFVKTKTGSLLHIGDGRLHNNRSIRTPDPVWLRLKGLRPSILLLSMGGNSLRIEKDGARQILEASTLTPIEAALITQLVGPKVVGGIGFYNHSMWKNRNEYIYPASQNEEVFEWAVSWLSPETKNVRLRPGYTFAIGTADLLRKKFDMYL